MSATVEFEHGSAGSPTKTQIHQKLAPWYYGAAAVVAVATTFVAVPKQSTDEIARLERLAPMIERAPTLSSEAREAIGLLVTQQIAQTGSDGSAMEKRRKLAVERVAGAMQAKQIETVGGGTDRGPTDLVVVGR